MPTPLASLFSTIDSYKRRGADLVGGLLDSPLDVIKNQLTDVGNASKERAAQTSALYKTPEGLLSFDPKKWSPEAAAAHDALTQDALGAMAGATVYHGSPHVFDKFKASKIGTGEGNQTYGHGLYLAENPEVARMYAKQLGKEGKPGNVYTVDLPDDKIARMADYDVPLGKQSAGVQDALRRSKSMLPENAMDDLGGDLRMLYDPRMRLEDFLGTANSLAPNWGEQTLQKLGVPGIKYRDQGSRLIATQPRQLSGGDRWSVVLPGGKVQIFPDEASAWAAYPKPTSNFVVFPGEEDALTILNRQSNFGLGSP